MLRRELCVFYAYRALTAHNLLPKASKKATHIRSDLRYTYETAAFNGAKQSIFIVIPKEIILGRIVWPYIFYTVIDIAFVFYLL